MGGAAANMDLFGSFIWLCGIPNLGVLFAFGRHSTHHGQLHRDSLYNGVLCAEIFPFLRILSYSHRKRHSAQNASLLRRRARTGINDLDDALIAWY